MAQPAISLIDLLAELELEVADESKNISAVLRKCIPFGRRAGAPELRAWALRELKGYETGSQLPPYRRFSAPVAIDGLNPSGPYEGLYLQIHSPVVKAIRHHLPQPFDLTFTIDEIEAMIATAEARGEDELKLGPRSVPLLIAHLNRQLPRYHQITRLYYSVPVSSVRGVIGQVRTALAEFIDELQTEVDASGAIPPPKRTREALQAWMPWAINIYAENITAALPFSGDIVNNGSKTTIKGNKTKIDNESGTVVAASAHVSAGTQQGLDIEKVKEFSDFVRGLLPQLALSGPDQEDLEAALVEVVAAATATATEPSEDQHGRFRKAIDRTKTAIRRAAPGFAEKAAIGAADDLLIHAIEAGVHSFGL